MSDFNLNSEESDGRPSIAISGNSNQRSESPGAPMDDECTYDPTQLFGTAFFVQGESSEKDT